MKKIAIINGIILDGTIKMSPIKDKIILIHDDIIYDIVSNDYDISGYKVIDLNNKYIMPGLINMHVHLPASGKPKKKAPNYKKLCKILTSNAFFRMIVRKMCYNFAKIELLSGVTTIRTVGGISNFDSLIRDKINNGKLGPRIIASNSAISVPSGHMAYSVAYAAESIDDVKKYFDIICENNSDLLKLMITGGVLDAKVKGEPGVVKMDRSYVELACKLAHDKNMVVASHVESPEGVKLALECGVDTIEHGAKLDDELLSLFKKNNSSLITTISPAIPYALFDKELMHATDMEMFNGKVVFDGIIDASKKCIENNIKVGLGTDTGCGFITHYDMYRELYYFNKYCNVSKEFALYTGTLGNATILKLDDKIGSIEKGKFADMIVTNNNPLDDLLNLNHPCMVIKGGIIINKPKYKVNKYIKEKLDNVL